MKLKCFAAALTLGLVMSAAASAGVIATYKINGDEVTEGATFDDILEIAGAPLKKIGDSDRSDVDWVYRCKRRGTGPCKVVKEGGEREMRIRFRNGRLKGVQYIQLEKETS